MLRFTVAGLPVPQGSMRGFVVNGRAVVTAENKAPHRAWRYEVTQAAREALEGQDRYPRPTRVAVMATFYLPRPKTQTKAEREERYVSVKPDVDKLLRSLLDSLTAARVFDDDAQVAHVTVEKVYAGEADPIGVSVSLFPIHAGAL